MYGDNMLKAHVLWNVCAYKEHHVVEISGALLYGVPHNHIIILARNTASVIIILSVLAKKRG